MKISSKPIKTVTVDDKQFNICVFSHRYLITDSNNDLFIDPFTLPLANDKTITDDIHEKITDAILKKIVTKKVDELNDFIYPSSLDEDSNAFSKAMEDRYNNGYITISFTVNDECKSIRLPLMPNL